MDKSCCCVKITAFWDNAPCSLVEVDQCFGGASIIKDIALMMEAVRTLETSVHFNETTRRYNPEGCNFYTCHHENLKSHMFLVTKIIKIAKVITRCYGTRNRRTHTLFKVIRYTN
jgi:hypothetical protein